MGESNAELSRKLKAITSTFQKLIECPICLEPLKVPFTQCTTGHTICTVCINNLEACPTCKAEFTTENHILVKNLLEAMPKFCRYSESGCQHVLEQVDDHEELCGFRSVACRENGCVWKMAVNQLLKHYETEHSTRHIFQFSLEHKVRWPNFNPGNCKSSSCPVIAFNQFLFMDIKNDTTDGQLTLKLEVLPIGKLIDDYFARVTFEKDDLNFTYSLKASHSQQPNSQSERSSKTSLNDPRSTCPDKFCMRVPQEVLSHFVDEKGALVYSIFFFRVKK